MSIRKPSIEFAHKLCQRNVGLVAFRQRRKVGAALLPLFAGLIAPVFTGRRSCPSPMAGCARKFGDRREAF